MTPARKKVILLSLAAALLFGSSTVQRSLNRDREALDLTNVAALDNAPPVLAFTTMALGGFRGIIANILWMRASDLQDEEKFFEMAQLADWITKLEPHYPQVWAHLAWNMAYNISVKFPDPRDRWRWVKRGIELLRDEGLKYNPNDVLIFYQLGWTFQHKMGENLDDANMYYKMAWLQEMKALFGGDRPNFDELINPKTPEQEKRTRLLIETYKMDPRLMKEVDEHYGPLEWRLPETHAIYWAYRGLKQAAANPSKVKPEDLIQLRRVIYQSMQTAFKRGHLLWDQFAQGLDFEPNLDFIPNASRAYEEAAEQDKPHADAILQAHRNFLRYAVYFLYGHGQVTNAAYWYNYLGTKYPDKPLLERQPNSLPRNLSLGDYAFAKIQEDINDPNNRDVIRGILQGLLYVACQSIIRDQPERAITLEQLAERVRAQYVANTSFGNTNRIPMPSMSTLKLDAAGKLLQSYTPEVWPAIWQKLGLDPQSMPLLPSTNAPPETPSSR